ncbi:IS4 family transposase [Paraburkholderia sp. EG285A]
MADLTDLGRKGDGEPGAKTLWIGMQRDGRGGHYPDPARRVQNFC